MQLEQQIVTFWKEKCCRVLPCPGRGRGAVWWRRPGAWLLAVRLSLWLAPAFARVLSFCGRGPAGYRVGDASLVFRPEVTFESLS